MCWNYIVLMEVGCGCDDPGRSGGESLDCGVEDFCDSVDGICPHSLPPQLLLLLSTIFYKAILTGNGCHICFGFNQVFLEVFCHGLSCYILRGI